MSHTRVVEHQSELGSWSRARRVPDPRLRPLVAREYVGFRQEAAGFTRWLEPPRPVASLIVTLEGQLRAGGRLLAGAWIGGLGDACELVEFDATHASLDLKLPPLGAYVLCGQPLRALGGGCVALDDLFGPAGRRLDERMRGADDWDTRFDLLERFLLDRAAVGAQPHPLVVAAWSRLRETSGGMRIGALAVELGASRRHLTATFHDQVGLPPKTVARLLRFERVCRRLGRDPARWADIAYDSGYCDQAHLNRDFRELAGTTPSDFLARLIPGGGVIGDGVAIVQDRAVAEAYRAES